eukprot:1158683-Pelagomonas_calceolata.AAC.6
MPVLRESGMAGRVEYVSQLPLFTDHPRAAMMLIDVLTDRGFSVSHTADVLHVPESVDFKTGAIHNRKETKHRCVFFGRAQGRAHSNVCGLKTRRLP